MNREKKRKEATEITRLGRKLKKREKQLASLKEKVYEIRVKQERERFNLSQECEKEMTESRTSYYATVRRPHKTWPRYIRNDTFQKESNLNLTDLLSLGIDVIRPIVVLLSSREYQSLSLTSKSFNACLSIQVELLNHFLDNHFLVHFKEYVKDIMYMFDRSRKYQTPLGLLGYAQRIENALFYDFVSKVSILKITNRVGKTFNLFQAERIFFVDCKTREFGELSRDEILFSDASWEAKQRNNTYTKKYNLEATKDMLSSEDIISLNIRPLREMKIEETHDSVDLYLLNHHSSENYYKRLTQTGNEVYLLYLLKPTEKKFCIYYDWFFIKRLLKHHRIY